MTKRNNSNSYIYINNNRIGEVIKEYARERQIPMKPIVEKTGSFTYGKCGRCKDEYVCERDKYCSNCGQKIDWSEYQPSE